MDDNLDDADISFHSQKVLLCVDGSQVGAKILAFAAEMLPKSETTLCLMIVVEKPAGGIYDMKQDNKALKGRAQEMLDRMKNEAENLGFDKVVTHVGVGFGGYGARECLTECCLKHNFQKVFIGSSERDFLSRILRRPTAEYVQSHCPQSQVIECSLRDDLLK